MRSTTMLAKHEKDFGKGKAYNEKYIFKYVNLRFTCDDMHSVLIIVSNTLTQSEHLSTGCFRAIGTIN